MQQALKLLEFGDDFYLISHAICQKRGPAITQAIDCRLLTYQEDEQRGLLTQVRRRDHHGPIIAANVQARCWFAAGAAAKFRQHHILACHPLADSLNVAALLIEVQCSYTILHRMAVPLVSRHPEQARRKKKIQLIGVIWSLQRRRMKKPQSHHRPI